MAFMPKVVIALVAGYAIGAGLFETVGRPVLEFYGKDAYFEDFSLRYNDWGAWAVLIAGVTPFPYKVITILSGATALSLPVFIVASVLARGLRAVVRAGSDDRVEALNQLLWTYGEATFLPHGSAADGHAEDQPVWLTAGEDVPNGAQVLVLTDGVAADPGRLDGFLRVCDMFDGNDPEAVGAARRRWLACRDAGHALQYHQQKPEGGWQKAADHRPAGPDAAAGEDRTPA